MQETNNTIYRNFSENADLLKNYREKYLEQEQLISEYNGTRDWEERYLGFLIELEQIGATTALHFAHQNAEVPFRRLTDNSSNTADQTAETKASLNSRIIDLSLDKAIAQVAKRIDFSNKVSLEKQFGFSVAEGSAPIVPPQRIRIPETTGNRVSFNKPKIQERFIWILDLLKQTNVTLKGKEGTNISLDPKSCEVYFGSVAEDQRRTVPYIIITIPSIRKQILVCEEVNEATFFSHQIYSYAVYENSKNDKQQLEKIYGLKKLPFPPGNAPLPDRKAEWLNNLLRELNSDLPQNPCYIDMQEFTRLKEAFLKTYPEPLSIGCFKLRKDGKYEFNFTDFRNKLSVNGRKCHILLTLSGFSDFNRLNCLKFLSLMYGAENDIIGPLLTKETQEHTQAQELGNDPEKWKTFITQLKDDEGNFLYTAEKWKHMTVKNLEELEILRKGYNYLLGIFQCPKQELYFKTDCYIPSKLNLFFLGTQLFPDDEALKTTFEAELERVKQNLPIEQKAQELGNDPEKWREFITQLRDNEGNLRYTAEKCRQMPTTDINNINILGKKLYYLLGIFGCPKQEPYFSSTRSQYQKSRLNLLFLGTQLFPDDEALKTTFEAELERVKQNLPIEQKAQELGNDPEKWREFITQLRDNEGNLRYTAETWKHMTIRDFGQIAILGKGYNYLLGIFGCPKEEPYFNSQKNRYKFSGQTRDFLGNQLFTAYEK
jgi:hypothetical protein